MPQTKDKTNPSNSEKMAKLKVDHQKLLEIKKKLYKIYEDLEKITKNPNNTLKKLEA
ncbi:MAG: hypothetical protein AAB540_01465 [Patescibacteria group bacterium]